MDQQSQLEDEVVVRSGEERGKALGYILKRSRMSGVFLSIRPSRRCVSLSSPRAMSGVSNSASDSLPSGIVKHEVSEGNYIGKNLRYEYRTEEQGFSHFRTIQNLSYLT